MGCGVRLCNKTQVLSTAMCEDGHGKPNLPNHVIFSFSFVCASVMVHACRH